MKTVVLFCMMVAMLEQPTTKVDSSLPDYTIPEGWTQLQKDYVRTEKGDTLMIVRRNFYTYQILTKYERDRAFK